MQSETFSIRVSTDSAALELVESAAKELAASSWSPAERCTILEGIIERLSHALLDRAVRTTEGAVSNPSLVPSAQIAFLRKRRGELVLERDRLLDRINMIAILTDKWLGATVRDPYPTNEETATIARMVVELRALLPADTRYDNG